jgi:serine O-acetyltransferase
MIRSKQEYLFFVEADRIAKAIPKALAFRDLIINVLYPNYVWRFQKSLRKVEYYKNCKKGLISTIYYALIYRRFKNLSYRLGFSIPPNVFGPGLSIAHHGTIVVNSTARVGSNCRLHAGVNIGSQAGYGYRSPKIGNNCYIGPGAKIFGEISLADNIAIGANSVVNKSFVDGNISIAGVPAIKISDIDIYDIIIPATEIIKRGLEKSAEAVFLSNVDGITKEIKSLL